MKCPNCQAELKDDKLYCENCGTEINIVPEFVPEEADSESALEKNVAKVLKDRTQPIIPVEPPKFNKKLIIPCAVGGVMILILLTVLAVKVGHSRSLDYQLKEAYKYKTAGNYNKAVEYLLKAKALSSFDYDINEQLVFCYEQLNDSDSYVNILKEIVSDGAVKSAQKDFAYERLVRYYTDNNDYEAVNELLNNCGDTMALEKYSKYLCEAPVILTKSGDYDTELDVEMESPNGLLIYYTLDGSEPTKDSSLYTEPVHLSDGSYTLKARCYNSFDTGSEITVSSFSIDVPFIESPVVTPDSGDFTSPKRIEINDLLEGISVYYTTDNTEPDENSQKYINPISIPVGDSQFSFIAIRDEDHKKSQIVKVFYSFKMNSNISVEDAQGIVIEYEKNVGHIKDYQGHFDSTEASYVYICDEIVNIAGISDFFIVSEIYLDGTGGSVKTGKAFAVDCYDTRIYEAISDSKGAYSLKDLYNER
ncbi:MAG: chitobiase/beta-hexosaminidase C-terminal domain-containing protein [Lachnospiraceae bacterium]|nr:chitobiase/beta-hexosaminidase C-terminal domain-containing protein [Lachnospiraceae bacterium]